MRSSPPQFYLSQMDVLELMIMVKRRNQSKDGELEKLEKRLKELEKGLEFWKTEFTEFPQRYDLSVDKHYGHIVNNLLHPYESFTQLARESLFNENDFEQCKQDLLEAEDADNCLFTYFHLLKIFPGYRQAELTSEGFFTEFRDTVTPYVIESFRVLELVYGPSRLSIEVSGIDSDYFNEFPLLDVSLTKLVERCKSGNFCTYSERFRPNSLTMALTEPEAVERMDQLGEEIKRAALGDDINKVREIRRQMYEMDTPK